MRLATFTGSFLVMFFFAQLVLAQPESDHFEGDELKAIRNISQSLLKVRGQKRRQVLDDTRPIREDLSEIRDSLEAMANELDRPSLVVHDRTTRVTASEPLTPQPEPPLWGQLMSYLNSSSDKRAGETKPAKPARAAGHLQRAKRVISQRKALIEDELPSFWQIGKPAEPRKKLLSEALTELETDIEALDGLSGVERTQKIRALVGKLGGKPQPSNNRPPVEINPTITSITRHYRE